MKGSEWGHFHKTVRSAANVYADINKYFTKDINYYYVQRGFFFSFDQYRDNMI